MCVQVLCMSVYVCMSVCACVCVLQAVGSWIDITCQWKSSTAALPSTLHRLQCIRVIYGASLPVR